MINDARIAVSEQIHAIEVVKSRDPGHAAFVGVARVT